MYIHPNSNQTRIVVRNGIRFQVPLSNHSSRRYSVHSAGDGVGWATVETLDVDQPLGLSYRQMNHIAIGVRKRISQQHTSFADATVGGLHIPGKCSIVDILDATGDMTNYMDDGSYTGGGLVWCVSTGTTFGVLYVCSTGDGTYTPALGDPTILKMHPDKQWGGGDVSWTGDHKFGGDVSVDGTTVLTGVFLDGTVTFNPVAGENGPTFKIFGDWSTRANNTTYTARTDGFVSADNPDGNNNVRGFTPSGTIRQSDYNGNGTKYVSILMPVKGGDTWDVSGASNVYWLPLGDNT